MPWFVVRVELHHASEAHYQTLHSAMAAQGLGRTITADDGRRYHLPTGLYAVFGSHTIDSVRSAAQRAVLRTGKAAAIVVSEGDNVAWSGLQRVVPRVPKPLGGR